MEKDCYITQILGRFRRGDEEAILEVYDANRNKFVGVLYKKYRDHFQIHDIIAEYQECLSILYEYAFTKPDFTIRSSIGAYLIQMGKYRLLKRIKEMKETDYLEEALVEIQEEWITDEAPFPMATTDKAPLFYAFVDEQMQEPGATMLELLLQGKNYKEICGELADDYPDLSPGAVKARIHRSVKKFRKWMNDENLPRGQDG